MRSLSGNCLEALRTAIRADSRSLSQIANSASLSASSLSRFLRHERSLSAISFSQTCAALGYELRQVIPDEPL